MPCTWKSCACAQQGSSVRSAIASSNRGGGRSGMQQFTLDKKFIEHDGRHRLGDMETLCMVAAHRGELVQHLGIVHTFGGDAIAEAMRKFDDAAHDGLIGA